MKTFEQFNELDPYNEENWNERVYTATHQAYLIKLQRAMENFFFEYNNLSDLWSESPLGIDVSEFLDDSYPFDVSFDDIDVKAWLASFYDKVRGII
jgi:hypothetical protein